jgi:murein DD-endopeptidase MepM/ murein hydrolase activator NlpD
VTPLKAAFLALLISLLVSVVAAATIVRHKAGPLASVRPIEAPPVLTPVAAGITSQNVPKAEEMQGLFKRRLLIPVEGVSRERLRDNFDDKRGSSRRHEALDIMAPRGTPVVAVDDGRVVKLFNSKAGGITLYQFDRDESFAYYYAHLDRYAEGVKEGSVLKRGDLVGYVGSTGNAPANAPHLHFTIFRLGPDKRWWTGDAVNPYPFLVEARAK